MAAKESKKKRFGTIAIDKGYLTEEQLISALKLQVEEDISTGKHRLIGVILYDQGMLDATQIKDILDAMLRAGSAAV